ncbi:DinB family protein [Micromonospora sp. NPDC049891]|uniref:DinB family protein n=1 Tax=Micromonospora sp. NPDC049891 TaxID=3155655 RepID=UPI0033EE417D
MAHTIRLTADEGPTMTETDRPAERADLLQALRQHRFHLRNTARDLTDQQAAERSTVSELCVGGVIKHVAYTERGWADFILKGPVALGSSNDPGAYERHAQSLQMLPGETLAGILAAYDEVARHTDEIVATLPDLNACHPLPEAPWFEPGAQWSARRVLLHIIAETSQHAGHADIIREAIDGAKSMG